MHDDTNDDSMLTSELRAVAAADAAEGASGQVKTRLLNEVRAIRRVRRQRQVTAALATAAVLFIWMVTWFPKPPVPATTGARVEQPSSEYATPFLSLSYGGGLPGSNAQIVRMRFPRTALRRFGLLSFDASDASAPDTVWADVLVGENGMARAVRFLRPAVEPRSTHVEQTRP